MIKATEEHGEDVNGKQNNCYLQGSQDTKLMLPEVTLNHRSKDFRSGLQLRRQKRIYT